MILETQDHYRRLFYAMSGMYSLSQGGTCPL